MSLDESAPDSAGLAESAALPESAAEVGVPGASWATRLRGVRRAAVAGLTVLAGWWVVAWITGNPMMMPAPPEVFSALAELAVTDIPGQAAATLYRVGVAFALATVTAIPVGMLIGSVPIVRKLIEPTLEVLRPIPAIAWIPIIMILFGIGNVLAISVVFYAAFFPILLNTVLGASTLDVRYREAARTLGAGRLQQFWHVTAPGMLPTVVAGLRIGISFSWMSVVAAEMIGASSGLGYRLLWSQQNFLSADVLAYMVTIGITGLLLDQLLVFLGKVLTPWRPRGGTDA